MGFPAHLFVVATLVAAPDGKPFKTPEAVEAWMVGYHRHPEPTRLRGALREALTLGLLGRPAVIGFFTEAYRANPEVKAALQASLPQGDLMDRLAAIYLLRAMNEDITDLLILLPDEYREKLAACPTLPDAKTPLLLRPEPTPEEIQRALSRLDQAVGAYWATGEPAVLRVLLEGLSGAGDYPAFIAWSEAGRKNPNPGPAVSRGCVYSQARNAMLSLQSKDPSVAKVLQVLATAPGVSEGSRRELTSLQPTPKP